MAQTIGRNDVRYKASCAELKKRHEPCHLCGNPIDQQLKWPHPLSWSADHITPLSKLRHLPLDHPARWRIDFLRPAHLRCNESRQAKPLAHTTTQQPQQRPDLNPSQNWLTPGPASKVQTK